MSDDAGQTLFNVDSLPTVRELLISFNGDSFSVSKDNVPFVIGRDESCDLSVESQFASRQHCRILFQNKNFVLEDSSTNGTFVRMGMAQPSQLNNTLTVITGNGVLKLGESIAVGDKQVVQFKAIY
jgi:pSer/pThr/pTyr-binding forkhead associated (FHA) protein